MELCSSEICNDPLIVVKAPSVIVMGLGKKPVCVHSTSHRPRAGHRCSAKGRVMLITICRLYDSYGDADRVVLMLGVAGLPPSETSVISNNSDTWYGAAKTANVVPLRKDGGSREAGSKVEGAAIGAAIGAAAASLITMLAIP